MYDPQLEKQEDSASGMPQVRMGQGLRRLNLDCGHRLEGCVSPKPNVPNGASVWPTLVVPVNGSGIVDDRFVILHLGGQRSC